MATIHNNGWDFVKEGETYQYKEGGLIGMVKILENKSTDEEYRFLIKFLKSTFDVGEDPITISGTKRIDGHYSGMCNFYEHEEYWVREYKYIYEE